MNKILYCLRGVSGSGKSFLSREICYSLNNIFENNHTRAERFETDNYFIDCYGEYAFNASLLGEAHEWNTRQVVRFYNIHRSILASHHLAAIVSNTFTTKKEIRQLLSRLKELGAQPDIIRIQEPATPWWVAKDLETMLAKNTHGVPKETLVRQLNRWQHVPQGEYSFEDAIKLVSE